MKRATSCNSLRLWARRYSFVRGFHWVMEREVTEQTAKAWLELFKNDEPSIRFVVSDKKPRKHD